MATAAVGYWKYFWIFLDFFMKEAATQERNSAIEKAIRMLLLCLVMITISNANLEKELC